MEEHSALVDETVAAGRKIGEGGNGAETQIPARMLSRVLRELPYSVNVGSDLDLYIDRLVTHWTTR
ncbi:hypothetical protein [Cryobacterium fucosi]|uniref:Uncharacterized protein n=1 Tax=Cryobacterium fucosi TaxID=1259157 RepID=A0A4R9B8P9_9MICO|nr:hypothetical protein [Cryobacterium fucosi]TFD78257.1 hypothetical protein E3T48_07400 [Cryobacterium fucosi]